MKLVTAKQMREIDRYAIDRCKIPSMALMENAGRGAADLIENLYRDALRAEGAVVLCGPGNNGGDGFVVARHLFCRGYDVACVLLGTLKGLRDDALRNAKAAKGLDIPLYEVESVEQLDEGASEAIDEAGVIVDALFGTGLTRPLDGLAAEMVAQTFVGEAPVVALDMPSGIDADTGRPLGPCVSADLTVTFGYGKIGQFVHPGLDLCGQVEVVNISLPPEPPPNVKVDVRLTAIEDALPLLAPRRPAAHKGTFGHALTIGGSRGMSGAAIMMARAAMLAGAGLVTVAVPNSLLAAADANLLEALKAGLPEDHAGQLSAAALGRALELAADKAVVAVGPGLGRSEGLETFLGGIASEVTTPLVIDADGLNNLAGNLHLLRRLERPVVLTPHPGEAARLLGLDTLQVQDDRLGAARRLAAQTGAVVVLKGARTITAAPDGQAWINPTGNPGMATGGMGDVLTGLIAGFIAQGVAPLRAAVAGAYLHGLAGDHAADSTGELALTAGAVLDALPSMFKELEDAAGQRDWDDAEIDAAADELLEEALRGAPYESEDGEKWQA